MTRFSDNVLKQKVSKFAQVAIVVPDELYDRFSEMVPLFVVQEILNCNITEEMRMHKEKAGRKAVKGTTKRLLRVTRSIHPFVDISDFLVSGTWLEAYSSLSIG